MNPKVIAEAIYDAFNRNDFDAALALTASDVEIVNVGWNVTYRGHDGFRTFMQVWKTMAPDSTVEIVRQLSGPDGVTNEAIFHGTHTGTLRTPSADIPATGKHLDVPICEVWRVRDGKLISLHNYADGVTILTQLGLLPTPSGTV
jgi:steroid delta-isomerase-like uncharacterized protein